MPLYMSCRPRAVALEALSHGTPIIVRRLGGLPEIVELSGGGLIYDGDEALLAALDALLDDEQLQDRLGRLGDEAVLRQWTVDVHLPRYFQIISDLRAHRITALSYDPHEPS